jgi:hypothetical protein
MEMVMKILGTEHTGGYFDQLRKYQLLKEVHVSWR